MDQQLLQLINLTWTSPAADRAMAVITNSGVWAPVLVVAGVLLAVFGGFRGRAFLIVVGLSIAVTDGLFVNFGKEFFERPRPATALPGIRTVHLADAPIKLFSVAKPLEVSYSPERILGPGGRSFPSGHAANNFAVAAVFAVFFRPWGWIAFIPAALVAYSRVYVGVHWPSDVLISALLGAGLALLVTGACGAIWQRFGHRLPDLLGGDRPSLFAR